MSIGAGELTELRREAERFLPDVCVLERKTTARDEQGYEVETWATLSTVACRVADSGLSPTERLIADQLRATVSVVVTLPALTAIDEEDRITTGGRTLEAVHVGVRSNEIIRRCLCSEVS